METKTGKRGRPKGSGKKGKEEQVVSPSSKKVLEERLSFIQTEGKKRGRKKLDKIEVAPVEVALDGEVEGTTIEKLKVFSAQVLKMDDMLNHEPWNMAMRVKRTETIARICYLIKTL